MTKRIIEITGTDYRLSMDADNIQIERLTTVDPTRAVGYDPEKHGTEVRQEWRSIGKYYTNIPAALEGVLHHALRNGPDTDVRGLLVELQSFRAELKALWSTEV
ncbi:hypothetical protein [Sporosarcina koreensis]|uniref:hypothetical protein n=1 Tax=Sporosarcina koreensis TaxID=334735 RepID=UPI0007572FB0|nr:hypothetical protein [Sporosarcina koreensis]